MLILASASPRRRELLCEAGFDFEIVPAKGEEVYPDGLSPQKTVICLASQKAAEIAVAHPTDTVIGADTVVYCEGRILGKPDGEDGAREMLRFLSGKVHSVFTGVCIINAENLPRQSFAEETKVEFYPLTETDIDEYIATGEPFDKAGAYGIQGKGCVLVKGIIGDYYNVMGLPVARLCRMLKKPKKL